MKFAPLAAAVIALAGFAAQAQTAPAPAASAPHPMMHEHRGDGAMREHMREHMQQRMAQRLDAFKQKLQITPQQQGAWDAWVAAMKPAAQPLQHPSRDELARMTTPERLERMKQVRAQHMAQQDQRAEATKALYAQLNAQQQKTFDDASLRLMARHGRRWHHEHG